MMTDFHLHVKVILDERKDIYQPTYEEKTAGTVKQTLAG